MNRHRERRGPWRDDNQNNRSNHASCIAAQTTRMVPGVCGGMAEYFNVDVSLIRVLFVVLTVLGGSRPSDLPRDVDPGPRPSKAKPSTGG
jgi:hypothetical protein